MTYSDDDRLAAQRGQRSASEIRRRKFWIYALLMSWTLFVAVMVLDEPNFIDSTLLGSLPPLGVLVGELLHRADGGKNRWVP